MANQDYLVITKADPTGAYTQIETGWDKTLADGAVKYRPTSAVQTTLVADTGEVAQSVSKGTETTGFTVNGGGNDFFNAV